jgi:ribonuclease VapC
VILDTSAVVATVLVEPFSERIGQIIGQADDCRIGTPTLVEASMVLIGREGPKGRLLLTHFMQLRNIDVLSFGEAHWRVAQEAFVRFGKGRHPAALNLGDCFTYATALVAGEPLLCIGDDFTKTDLELVPYEV